MSIIHDVINVLLFVMIYCWTRIWKKEIKTDEKTKEQTKGKKKQRLFSGFTTLRTCFFCWHSELFCPLCFLFHFCISNNANDLSLVILDNYIIILFYLYTYSYALVLLVFRYTNTYYTNITADIELYIVSISIGTYLCNILRYLYYSGISIH